MAEALGIVGACFNICQILSQIAKRGIELYEAPAEIKGLQVGRDYSTLDNAALMLMHFQDQLNLFRNILQSVELAAGSVTHIALTQALTRAHDILRELHELITKRIVRGNDASNSARRLAWFRHRQTIARLTRQFKDTRKAISEAMNTVTL